MVENTLLTRRSKYFQGGRFLPEVISFYVVAVVQALRNKSTSIEARKREFGYK